MRIVKGKKLLYIHCTDIQILCHDFCSGIDTPSRASWEEEDDVPKKAPSQWDQPTPNTLRRQNDFSERSDRSERRDRSDRSDRSERSDRKDASTRKDGDRYGQNDDKITAFYSV